MQTAAVVRLFVEAINARDVDAIVELCSQDHEFIDAQDMVVRAPQLRSAWEGYFSFMPLYGIDIEDILEVGAEAAVFGHAWGALSPDGATAKSWRRPCAWRARVEHGKVHIWQVFVDTKAVSDLL